MSIITKLLDQEEHLNELLNSKPPPADIHEQFKELFTNDYYKNTQKFLLTTFFTGYIVNFLQYKDDEQYITSFNIESVLMFKETGDYKFEEIGTMANSGLFITGNSAFPNIEHKDLRNILIDHDSKEIAFVFYDYDENNNKINIEKMLYNYNDIHFIKGQENLYELNNRKSKRIFD